MSLYPLKFIPILQKRIWGGEKLLTVLNKKNALSGHGESWEVSGVPGHISLVANGVFKDKSLQELINKYGCELLGLRVFERFGADFPILIKFLDAAHDLSIQVHPNDTLAELRHGSKGKNEMWYVMETSQEASLIVGFKEGVSKQGYKAALDTQNIESILERKPVREGDTFMIEAGTIHAIGAGVLLAEIQQTSDVTYRIFDFNRKDSDGNKRPLHTQESMEALNFNYSEGYKKVYTKKYNEENLMVASPYFTTKYLPVNGIYKGIINVAESFKILICVAGTATISNAFGSEVVVYGETVLLAAHSQFYHIEAAKDAIFLEVSL